MGIKTPPKVLQKMLRKCPSSSDWAASFKNTNYSYIYKIVTTICKTTI